MSLMGYAVMLQMPPVPHSNISFRVQRGQDEQSALDE